MASPLRLVFMGTPESAVPALEHLIGAGHEILAVYTRPPRPAGRGRRARPSPVHQAAAEAGVAVRSPKTLEDEGEQAAFAALTPDATAVVAYGLILPPPVLAAPRLGCLNAHFSLLPRWRGAAPVARAIMAGDRASGITIMLMDEGLDTGPILIQREVAMAPDETGGTLTGKLAALAGPLLEEALIGLDEGTLVPRPQPAAGACYAPRLKPADERLDWRLPAGVLERTVRALNPRPGAHFVWGEERIRVLLAEVIAKAPPAALPGTVVDSRLAVACGEGTALRPALLQRPGRRVLALDVFLRGFSIPPGTRLPCPATG